MQRASLLLLAPALTLSMIGVIGGCTKTPAVSADAKAKPSDSAGESQAEPAEPANPNQLSAEELELIAADPKSLTPEQNRKRGFALRKQIMANPDSPGAKSLEETREAVLNGDVTLPGEEKEEKQDPGLVIELPEHLKDQRVSKGEPAP